MPHPALRLGTPLRAGPFWISCIDYPPGLRQPQHSHDAFSMTVLLAGDIHETTRVGEAIGSALSVVVKPAGLEHANEVGPRGARTVQVAFLPEVAEELAEGAELGGWRWQHGGPACAPLLGLAGTLRSGVGGSSQMEDRILDAVAAWGDAPTGAVGPGWVDRVKEALDDELESDIGVRELARLVDAHPVSVSRAFRRRYGVTLSEYRRRERVLRAAARLGASSLSLSRIAHATGHTDHPHFCREFRRLTGLTPSQFRRLAAPVDR